MTVTLEGRDPFEVDTRPVDNVRFEDLARRNNWASVKDGPMRYMYFLAFAAAQRSGAWPREEGFDAFLDLLVDVDAEDDEDRPTMPDRGGD